MMASSLLSLSSMDLPLTPTMLLLLAGALLAAPLLSSLVMRKRSAVRRRLYHPLASSNFQFLIEYRRVYDYATEISRRHKSFRVLSSPFHSDVYTCDPAVVEHILQTNFKNYGKGKFNYEIMRDLLGDGIFAVDGEKWRHQRKQASFEFSTRSLREISSDIFKKNSVRLAHAIAQVADAGRVLDIQDWFVKSTMDSIFEISLGNELNSLQNRTDETSQFVKAMDEANGIVGLRFLDPRWKLMRFFNAGNEAVLAEKIRIVDDYVFKLIQSRTKEISKKGVERHDILSRFLNQRQSDLENLSDRYLRDIILSFILAGKDTTAGTLSWLFYLLCKHPRVEGKILDEIIRATGAQDGTTVEQFSASLTDEALSKMTYLHAAIVETLRLYPAVPMDGKICVSDDTLPDGYSVKAGEFIVYMPYCMGRMKDLWGEDAEMFRPERWLDENGNFCPESPFKFTAFQAGPRMCLGREFAYRQMKIFAAVLIRFFNLKLKDEKESVHYKLTFTLLMDRGLNVHVFRR